MQAEGGHLNIKLTAEEDEDLVTVEISDSGGGIPDENIEKIFEPYFSTKETGTGLGLAIVHKIVEVHQGTVRVDSKIGEGAKFTVKLPKAEQAAE